MQAEKSIPHTSSHMTADNFLQNHFNETQKETKTPTQGAFLALEKPSVGTDDFTMSVLKKAQKEYRAAAGAHPPSEVSSASTSVATSVATSQASSPPGGVPRDEPTGSNALSGAAAAVAAVRIGVS